MSKGLCPVRDVVHTDAAEQRRFMALPLPEQMLEIFLNGRETNGHVADVQRDIVRLELEAETAFSKINAVEADTDVRLHPLERDRSIWNWVIRVCILGTPIAVVVANYLTKA